MSFIGRMLQYALVSIAGLIAIGFVVFFVGFSQFVNQITQPVDLEKLPRADAIVVLTGEGSRIHTAIDLLESHRGKRLLITGVGSSVSDQTIFKTYAPKQQEIACCIDLDRQALDTKGNAKYTANWVSLNGFENLIVVTSNYHMPRSLELLQREMPEVTLIPAPVSSKSLGSRSIISLIASPKVMVEYGKLIASRFYLEPVVKYVWTALETRTSG